MANQNDSFIDEVTEDLRRDRLFAAMRRYGWIVIALIVALVAASAWREYARSRAEAQAQAFGDALLAAQEQSDAAARAEALTVIDPLGGAGRTALRDLLAAGAQTDAGQSAEAAERLTASAAAAGDDRVMQHLAQLKTVMLQGSAMEPAARDAALATLSAPGAPFELLALEQKVVALVDAGRPDDAIALIGQIRQKDGLTEALRRRLSDMLITLGAEPEPSADVPGDVGATLVPD
ncbi:tetratricopeptide repeat protein [uncultured Paracoccus sp.]|uniref:tetratricopeptide repeat protein n=1 Tax=uncultured Paracoccus sp. TaxID=189685 RepID=UPI002604DC14|nr:tetratricopeptide repeat protein [uncultured Paracoccus sp.]